MQSGNYRLDAKIIQFNYLACLMQEAREDNISARPLINDVPIAKALNDLGLPQFSGVLLQEVLTFPGEETASFGKSSIFQGFCLYLPRC